MIDFLSLCKGEKIPFMEEGDKHCHEGWIQVHCPFCGDTESDWHLGLNLSFGNTNCWRCGKHSVWEWLKIVLPYSYNQVWKKYSADKILVKRKETIVRKKNVPPPPRCISLKKIHRDYLISRKFNPDKLIETWDLKATTSLSGSWSWRIIAPVRNANYETVAYTGRAISISNPPRWKTTNASEMGIDPHALVYGIEKTNPALGILIVEGPSDVWRMGPGAIGLCGTAWTENKAAILSAYQRRFIMFDPEPTAQKKAEELALWLSPFPGETEIITGISTDPGALSQKEANLIMKDLGLFKGGLK